MRVGMQAWGSEGDIRPFMALGHGLVQRGHQVELVYTDIAERRYEAVAATLGIAARAVATPVIADQEELSRIGRRIMNTRDPLRQARIIMDRLLRPVETALFDAAVDLCGRSDLVVRHLILHHMAAAAELTRTPEVSVSLTHTTVPSRYIHPQGLPRIGPTANAVFWRIARLVMNLTTLPGINRFRSRHGLAPQADVLLDTYASHLLNLIAVSPVICAPRPDWPSWNRVCGFLSLPPAAHDELSPDLHAFLESGPPPIFMGFGSLMPADPSALAETLAILGDAAAIAGCRAIIQADLPAEAGARVLITRRAPHDQVFGRCAAVVHHCGAGTTHTALRAGIPSVPVPHLFDQVGWAAELRRLGVATRPIDRRSLTAWRLAARIITALGDETLKARAREIAAQMATDNGPATATALIEQLSTAL